jgi:hypothetical protein
MSLWSAEKRLLTLDGGGVRGIIAIAFLERIEAVLKARSGKGEAFRLSDHFHLVGGTSTGAIIAAALALGRTAAETKALYFDLAPRVFRRGWSRIPYLQARFASKPLAEILARELGDMTLEDSALKTYLAIVMKRVDTGSPWIVSNLPGQPYWNDSADGRRTGNRHYKVANVVRASTAAPYFFGPERIPISADVVGSFIDGGVTPYNCPILPTLMLATMRSYGLCWPLGPDKLSIVSIGTGRYPHRISSTWQPALTLAVDTLRGLIDDCRMTSLMLMQWLGETEAPTWLNSDIGTLEGDCLTGQPLLAFQRYDLLLEPDWLRAYFGREFKGSAIKLYRSLDRPAAMADLYALAKEAAEREIPLPEGDEPTNTGSPSAHAASRG